MVTHLWMKEFIVMPTFLDDVGQEHRHIVLENTTKNVIEIERYGNDSYSLCWLYVLKDPMLAGWITDLLRKWANKFRHSIAP